MSDLKVVKFQKNNAASDSNQEVIRLLQEALEQAKSGDYNSMAVVMLSGDGGVCDCWHSGGRPYVMVGAIEALKTDFIAAHIQPR